MSTPPNPPKPQQTSLMRSLGQFVGHIAKGISGPGQSRTHQVSRSVETEQRETPAGTVTLRRTVVEEVIVPTAALPKDQQRSHTNSPHTNSPHTTSPHTNRESQS